jgi:hypothetical protein
LEIYGNPRRIINAIAVVANNTAKAPAGSLSIHHLSSADEIFCDPELINFTLNSWDSFACFGPSSTLYSDNIRILLSVGSSVREKSLEPCGYLEAFGDAAVSLWGLCFVLPAGVWLCCVLLAGV